MTKKAKGPAKHGPATRGRLQVASLGILAGVAAGFAPGHASAQPVSRGQSSSCGSSSSFESGGAIYFGSSSSSCASGGQIGGTVGIATIRTTRQVTETLNDQNVSQLEKSNAAPVDTALPTFVAQYAPLSDYVAVKKGSPIVVDRTPVPPKYRVFGTVFGGGFDSTGFAGAAEKGDYYGGLVGVDYQVQPNSILGIAIGGSGSRVDIDALTASGRVAGFNGSIYFITAFNKFYAQTVTTLSSFSNDTTRFVPGVNALEKASFGSFEARERLEFGRIFDLGDVYGIPKFKVVPFIAVEIANLHQNGHTEYDANGGGGAASLTTEGTDILDVPGFIGARVEASYALGNGMTIRPIVRVAYVHQFASAPILQTALISSPSATFASNTTLLGPDSVLTKAGFELDVVKNTVVFANFDGLFSKNDDLYGGRAGVRYSF